MPRDGPWPLEVSGNRSFNVKRRCEMQALRIVGIIMVVIGMALALLRRRKELRKVVRIWRLIEGLLVYFTFPLVVWLAKRKIFCVAMEEGTFVVILKGAKMIRGPKTGRPITKGAFSRAYLQWSGWTLSQKSGVDAEGNRIDKWDVVPEGTIVYDLGPNGNLVNGEEQREPYHPYGAIRFFLWPLERVYMYEFAWTNIDIEGNIQSHAPMVLDYAFAREDIYFGELFDVEDIDTLHLYLAFLVRARIINPKKALFDIENWLEAVLNRTRTLIRGYVATQRYKDLHSRQTQVGGEVWRQLMATGRIDEFRYEYGVLVPEGGIDFQQIEPPEEYREDTLKKWRAERTAEEIEVGARAERTRVQILGFRGLLGRILDRIGGK